MRILNPPETTTCFPDHAIPLVGVKVSPPSLCGRYTSRRPSRSGTRYSVVLLRPCRQWTGPSPPKEWAEVEVVPDSRCRMRQRVGASAESIHIARKPGFLESEIDTRREAKVRRVCSALATRRCPVEGPPPPSFLLVPTYSFRAPDGFLPNGQNQGTKFQTKWRLAARKRHGVGIRIASGCLAMRH